MQHSKSRTAYLNRGRIWLIFLFLVLRGVDCFVYFYSYAANKRTLYPIIISDNLWSIALLSAMWFRQTWARYTLISMILALLGLGLILEGDLQEFLLDKYAPIMGVACGGYLAVVLILICSPSIHKLTSRSFG